jgi:hypothetical protein
MVGVRANNMRPGEQLWTPTAARIRDANVTLFSQWLKREKGLKFDDYAALWRWSVEDLDGFWGALFELPIRPCVIWCWRIRPECGSAASARYS